MKNIAERSLKTYLAITIGCLATEVLAQDDEHVYELDPLEVSAEREPGDLTIGSNQIERIQATDLTELFSNQSSLAVGGGSPVSQKIYVRGFEDTMLNVTVDGAQQIGELYHHQARLQLEPDFIKQIQLDAGAGAATNGAGALTGAMKVSLKDAFDMLGSDQKFGAYVKGSAGFSGDGNYKVTGAAYGEVSDGIGLIAVVSHADGDDYEDGNGDLVTPTGYTHERGYLKLNGGKGGQTWNLAYERLHDTGTYYERPHMRNFTGTFVLSDHEMNRETATFNYGYNAGDDRIDLKSTLYWTDSDFENHRNTTGALYGRGNLESMGFDLRNSMRFSSNSITYGVDYRIDISESRQQATPPPFWGSSEQNAQIIGIFAQDEWKPADSLTLSGGLRFDAYRHDVDTGVGAGAENNDEGFSPNISAEWAVIESLTLRAGYARAFRGITIREAFFNGLYAHDGTLESEIADNVELGFSWMSNGYFLRGTVYEQNIENYISAQYVGSTVWGYWRNMGDAKVEGYELEAGKHWENVFVSIGVWEADNTFDDQALTDSDLGLGTSIGRTWTARAQYNFDPYHLEFGLFARYVEEEPNEITPTAPPKESYFTADVFVSWRPKGDDTLIIAAAVRNVFDEFYYDHSTYSYHPSGSYIGFPAKGREPSVSVTYKF